MSTAHLAPRTAGLTAAIALLFTLASAPAHADKDPEAKADDQIVCTKERSTGSHVPRRICVTRAQHEERRKQDQAAMERLRSKPKGTGDLSGR